jgi:hypothetical protein
MVYIYLTFMSLNKTDAIDSAEATGPSVTSMALMTVQVFTRCYFIDRNGHALL